MKVGGSGSVECSAWEFVGVYIVLLAYIGARVYVFYTQILTQRIHWTELLIRNNQPQQNHAVPRAQSRQASNRPARRFAQRASQRQAGGGRATV